MPHRPLTLTDRAVPAVVPLPSLGKVAAWLGSTSLYLAPAEADQLALALQRAAQQLRINAATAQQYSDALNRRKPK